MRKQGCLLLSFGASVSAGFGTTSPAFSFRQRAIDLTSSTIADPRRRRYRKGACTFPTRTHFMASSHDTTTSAKETTLRIPKPLGIIVEEVDATNPTKGVCIGQVNEGSNAASCGTDLCIHDRIVAVNGMSCADQSFEVVMDMIALSTGDYVQLTLKRPVGHAAVLWPNRICVAAPVGEYLGNVASEAKYPIPYSCRSGSCGSCEHFARLDGGEGKRYRPCSAKVPKGVEAIEFLSQY